MMLNFLKKLKDFFFSNIDKDTLKILEKEKERQARSLELIASENFTSKAVLEANGSIFTNKYAEGYPGKRYYGGCENIDELERLCQKRALQAFNIHSDEWGVNVQSYSGSPANFAVYTAFLKPGDKIMGLALSDGGHLTHGHQTETKKISASSIYFQSKPYTVDKKTFLIDYCKLEQDVLEFKPNILIVGASAYVRDYNYIEFRRIANLVGAKLMADIAHTSGLIASKLLNNPFEYADVVTTTTHKTLRGPRGALIFYKKEYKDLIDFAVFPGINGGAHYNTIAAISTALNEVNSEKFKKYSYQIIKNAKLLSTELINMGYNVITLGTDNHIVLIDVKSKGITGSKYEKLAELCDVSVNKNMIATDKSALSPSGIRIGTPAMTTRGFKEKEFVKVAKILDMITKLSIKIQSTAKSNKLIDFILETNNYSNEIQVLKKHVNKLCVKRIL